MCYTNLDGIDWFVCRIFGTFIPKLLFVAKMSWVASHLVVITELLSSVSFVYEGPGVL